MAESLNYSYLHFYLSNKNQYDYNLISNLTNLSVEQIKEYEAKNFKRRRRNKTKNKINNKRPEYYSYIESKAWKKKRNKKLKSTNRKCEICGQRAIQVHHKHYNTLGHESLSDLLSVCNDCHMNEHNIPTELDSEFLNIIKK